MQAATKLRSLVMGSVACLVLVACASPGPAATSASPPTPTPTVVATPVVTATPSPSAPSALEIDDLPGATLDPSTLTAVCDPEAAQADIDFGEATINCPDSLQIAVQALATVTNEPIERLSFQRPVCASAPCTDDELSTATVTGWTSSESLTVALDSRLTTVSIPTHDSSDLLAEGWIVRGASRLATNHQRRAKRGRGPHTTPVLRRSRGRTAGGDPGLFPGRGPLRTAG